jgi:DNA repair ATPase RecN
MSTADRTAQEEFLKKVARLYRALYGATHTAEDVQDRLKQIREALRQIPGAEKQLGAVADSIQQQDREIVRALRGDREIAKRSEPVPSSINDRIESIMEGERFSLAKPTQSHIDQYNIAAAEFGDVLSRLRTLVDVDLSKLEKDMEAAGAPWTPGRVPEWSEK